MARHKGLGRGLDALLGAAPESSEEERLAQLPVEKIGRASCRERV